MNSKAKSKIREQMRARRQALSAVEQEQSGRCLADQACAVPILNSADRIASYRAVGGEINAIWLESRLRGDIYLPRVTSFKQAQMTFLPKTEKLTRSSLGIEEPGPSARSIPPDELDVVLVPLVAFRRDGSRLGMGAGFYDKAFAFRQERSKPRKPVLIGLAYHFQECDELEPEPWDVPLDAIITDRDVFHIQPLSKS